MSEKTVTGEAVRAEHLAEVRVPVQWAYLLSVIGGGFLAMVILIALLGG